MTDATPKPKRKRRRWIIAGVLLFAVAVAGWWYWTRGDARFVGKWDVWEGGLDQGDLQFHENGTGVNEPKGGRKHTFRWRVAGDKLILGYDRSGTAFSAIRSMLATFAPYTLGPHLGIQVQFVRNIEYIGSDEILFRDDTGDPTTLRRVPKSPAQEIRSLDK